MHQSQCPTPSKFEKEISHHVEHALDAHQRSAQPFERACKGHFESLPLQWLSFFLVRKNFCGLTAPLKLYIFRKASKNHKNCQILLTKKIQGKLFQSQKEK